MAWGEINEISVSSIPKKGDSGDCNDLVPDFKGLRGGALGDESTIHTKKARVPRMRGFCAFVFGYKPFGEISSSEWQSVSMEEKPTVLILLLVL